MKVVIPISMFSTGISLILEIVANLVEQRKAIARTIMLVHGRKRMEV